MSRPLFPDDQFVPGPGHYDKPFDQKFNDIYKVINIK